MIDILVPTYNRPNDIKEFISQINKQSYSNYKVIIIDDHGELSPKNHIPDGNPAFKFIRLPKNFGQAHARNVGIKQGNGEIVVSLDDDAWFEDTNALNKIISFFNKYPDCGCVMFDVRTPERPWISELQGIKNEGQIIGAHITCGCAYRRSVLENVGGFSDFLHSGGEESDLTFKILKCNYKIRFSKDIKVFHNYVPGVRSDNWYFQVRYNTSRNDLLIIWMRYPLLYVIPYTVGKLIGHFKFVIRNKRRTFKSTYFIFLSFWGAVKQLPTALKNRDPLSVSQFNEWLKIRW